MFQQNDGSLSVYTVWLREVFGMRYKDAKFRILEVANKSLRATIIAALHL